MSRFPWKTKNVDENIVYTLDDVVEGVEIEIQPMRKLGEGRWDKILKEEIVSLSEADNYEDAKEEWKATGNCWWGKANDERRTPPSWMQGQHIGHCLCGHVVYYHFEIENMQTGVKKIVGSDHIHAFMIIRAVAEELGLDINAVTERQIKQWLAVRVRGMINDAWWYNNGDEFEEIFNEVKELDLRINVTVQGDKKYWDRELRQFRPVVHIRKRGNGSGVRRNIASIVWRWNHPKNYNNQKEKRGWPNKKLWNDMNLFSARLEDHIAQTEKMDAKIEKRKKYLTKLDSKKARKIAASYKRSQEAGQFSENCVLFDIPEFDHTQRCVEKKHSVFLIKMHRKILASTPESVMFTPHDLDNLKRIKTELSQPLATQEDFDALRALKRTVRERGMTQRVRIPRLAYKHVIDLRIKNLTRSIESDRKAEEAQTGRWHPSNRRYHRGQ